MQDEFGTTHGGHRHLGTSLLAWQATCKHSGKKALHAILWLKLQSNSGWCHPDIAPGHRQQDCSCCTAHRCPAFDCVKTITAV